MQGIEQVNSIKIHEEEKYQQFLKDLHETEAVREYVDAIENNIEYFKEWCAIYKTQKEIAQQKVSILEMKVLQLNEVIRQYQNGTI